MLAEFLSWWLARLSELVPAWLQRRLATVPRETVLVADPALRAVTLTPAGADPPARFALDAHGIAALRAALGASARPASISLALPAGLLLERHVSLPLAAARDPGGVLRFEMDRLTPFIAADVVFGWSIRQRDRKRGRLELALWLIPTAPLRPLLAALADAGAAVHSVLEGWPAAPRRLPLSLTAAPADGWRGSIRRLSLAGCALLALAAVSIPFLRQSLALAATEARIAALRPRANQAAALRQRLSAAEAGGAAVARERARLADPMDTLATLTALLPDDTHLTQLSLHEGRLEVSGLSQAAARLIGLLAASPALRNPSFAAPVTRAETGSGEMFSIRAELGGPAR